MLETFCLARLHVLKNVVNNITQLFTVGIKNNKKKRAFPDGWLGEAQMFSSK